MIEILTRSGVFLELAPDSGFEIEMNNPILESDRIPVAFSTAISFPPSETNRSVFGYLPAMLLPPSVKMVSGVRILSGGIPILAGSLIYDSLDENGNLVYSFTEKDVVDVLNEKLHKLTNLPSSRIHGGLTADELVSQIRSGLEPGIGAPVLYDPEGSVFKFHNLPFSNYKSRFTPCVALSRLFSDIPVGIRFPEGMSFSILGLYKPFTGNEKGYGDRLRIAETLPDVTLLDVLKEYCKMTCSFVFIDSGYYSVIPFSQLSIDNPIDWDEKISDIHSFTIEKASGYGFGYQKEEVSDNGEATDEFVSVSTLKGVLGARRVGKYTPVRCTLTGDAYSVPPHSVSLVSNYDADACEILNVDDEDYDNEIDGEKTDNRLSASLIRNVPVCFRHETWEPDDEDDPQGHGTWMTDEEHYRVAGLVSFPADGGERDSKIIIGEFGSGQLVGKGYGMSDGGADLQVGSGLTARQLYSLYHRSFAAWLAKDRQVISVDVNLTMEDISAFRMWQVVTVRNRLFLVKRLNLSVSTMSERILCSAELISL